MTTNSNARAAFEKLAAGNSLHITRNDDGEYISLHTAHAFVDFEVAWEESRAALLEELSGPEVVEEIAKAIAINRHSILISDGSARIDPEHRSIANAALSVIRKLVEAV